MSDDRKPDYEVGYGKPPKATRFSPGQSGNSKGRTKGTKNFATVLAKELDARVIVKEGVQRKTIAKREAVAKQLVNKAVGGDLKAIQPLLSITNLHERQAAVDGTGTNAGPFATEADAAVTAGIIQRIRAGDLPQPPRDGQEAAAENSRDQEPISAIAAHANAEGENQ